MQKLFTNLKSFSDHILSYSASYTQIFIVTGVVSIAMKGLFQKDPDYQEKNVENGRKKNTSLVKFSHFSMNKCYRWRLRWTQRNIS